MKHPSMALRFVERDGKRILQQYWQEKGLSPVGAGWSWEPTGEGEWLDVPLLPEDDDVSFWISQ